MSDSLEAGEVMAAQVSSSRRTDKDVSLWPWGPKAAAFTAPAALILLLILLAVVKSIAGWPADDYQGWVLLGIVLLSLMPLLLLLVETTVRHRTLVPRDALLTALVVRLAEATFERRSRS